MKGCGIGVNLGQGMLVNCGTYWGESQVLCDECKLKLRQIDILDKAVEGLGAMSKPPVTLTDEQKELIKRIIEES